MLEQNRPIHEFTGVARFHAAGAGARAGDRHPAADRAAGERPAKLTTGTAGKKERR